VSRYRFIATEKANYPVELLCRVLEVASSGYYVWRHRQPSRRSQVNAALTEQIREVLQRSGGMWLAYREFMLSYMLFVRVQPNALLEGSGTRRAIQRLSALTVPSQ
jgi:hypothetical protein